MQRLHRFYLGGQLQRKRNRAKYHVFWVLYQPNRGDRLPRSVPSKRCGFSLLLILQQANRGGWLPQMRNCAIPRSRVSIAVPWSTVQEIDAEDSFVFLCVVFFFSKLFIWSTCWALLRLVPSPDVWPIMPPVLCSFCCQLCHLRARFCSNSAPFFVLICSSLKGLLR